MMHDLLNMDPPQLAGWIRGILPYGLPGFFQRSALRRFHAHITPHMPGGTIFPHVHHGGIGFFVAGAHEADLNTLPEHIYLAMRSFEANAPDSFFRALAIEFVSAEYNVDECIDRARRRIDHCNEYSGYYFVNGSICYLPRESGADSTYQARASTHVEISPHTGSSSPNLRVSNRVINGKSNP